MIFMTLLFLGSREISGDATIANEENVNVENVDVVVDRINISDSGMTSITAQGDWVMIELLVRLQTRFFLILIVNAKENKQV